ncbi:MAG: serine/threonine-protein kinase [Pirellulaceae bacterium]
MQSNSDDAFDAAVDAFIVELESNPQLDPQQLVVAFPDRKSEILRLFADVRREPSPAELQDLPPLPGQYSVIAPRTLLEQVQGGPNSPAAVGKHALPPSGAAVIQLPQQLGAYTLVERIGSGGMGEVYRAVQEQPIVREVAVKIVKPETGGRELLARFDNERRSLARMHHPNIAIVIDGGATEDERPYLVMELVRGVSITEYCSTHELGLRQRLKLLLKVCAGIQHAHQKSIIHRDIKPSNVLVTEVDHVPIPKVIDFGLAKVMADEQGSDDSFQSSHTLLGQILGTLQYMSPEQASLQNDRIDTRSDVFALGILLFELVTGTTPLAGQLCSEVPIDERLRAVRQQVPIRPSERCASQSTRKMSDS